MIYTCETHCDRALDDALEETGEAPYMERSIENNSSTSCFYCENPAVYKIK
ncbi:CxxH/CxxC protein [Salibacterium salarium]|uniref:CxxH/CxxC protein n=1 Tax=Salibacterium salarium TaxID=284579 RepID=UPI001639E08C|nr:CxxH/CxxC protein [Salibacterium salarium]